jgi:hypothetical protein
MILPWGTYVAVSDPPATPEAKRIILPPGTGYVARGVVTAVGIDVSSPPGFEAGAVIWYIKEGELELGLHGEVKMIDEDHIIAWEAFE